MANHNAGAVEVSDTIVHSTKIKTLQYITDQPMAQPAKNAMVSWQSRDKQRTAPLTIYSDSNQTFDKSGLKQR